MNPFSIPRLATVPRTTTTILLFLTIILVGTLTTEATYEAIAHQQAISECRAALSGIDPVINQTWIIASRSVALGSGPCNRIATQLRSSLATAPYVRAIDLVEIDGALRCSVQSAAVHDRPPTQKFVFGMLSVQQLNPQPSIPTLIARQVSSRWEALVMIDGRYVQTILARHAADGKMSLLVGEDALEAGDDSTITSDHQRIRIVKIASKHFPVVVEAHYSARDIIWLIHYRPGILLTIILFSAVIAWQFFVYASQPQSAKKVVARAVSAGEFAPLMQPLVDPETKSWIGAEVFLRWQHPQFGTISPELFIVAAEQSGCIQEITGLLMASVANALQDAPLPPGFLVSFNVCPSQLGERSLQIDCCKFLESTKAKQTQLILEITEREPISTDNSIHEKLRQLRSAGVLIALDDFGNGNANLVTLADISIDFLKIDKRLLKNSTRSYTADRIMKSTLQLAYDLGVRVIVEGVETSIEYDSVRGGSATALQGYYFARPMLIEAFICRMKSPSNVPAMTEC